MANVATLAKLSECIWAASTARLGLKVLRDRFDAVAISH